MKEKKNKKSALYLKKIYQNKFILGFILLFFAVFLSSLGNSFTSHSPKIDSISDFSNPFKIKTAHSAIITDPSSLIGKVIPSTGTVTDIAKDAATGAATGGSSWFSWEAGVKYLLSVFPRMLLFVIYAVCWLFYSLTYGLVYLSEGILKIFFDPAFVTSMGGFTTVTFVRDTAQLLANLCNMLYLFILLYIAIGTMLGIGNTKKLLVKMVIAALLTNFSLVISGIIIDFAQVLMHSFFSTGFAQTFNPGTKILSNIQESWGVGQNFSIENLFSRIGAFLWSATMTDLVNDMIKIMGLILFSLVLVVTLVTITILLVVRIVALWILLIVSPVAFTASVLPQTEKYWKEWFETFTKYAFTGPILIFFLWLAIKVSEKLSDNKKLAELANNVPNGNELRYTFYVLLAKNATVVFQLLVLILIVWAGILIANKFGIKGAKSFDQLFKSSGSVPRRIAKTFSVASTLLGRTAKVGGDFLAGRTFKKSEGYLTQADVALSTGDRKRYDTLREKAGSLGGRATKINKWKDRIIKTTSVADPLKAKKLFSAYLASENKKYEEQSEETVKSFWKKDILERFSGEKKRLILNAEGTATAKLNYLNNDYIEKNNKKFELLQSLKNAEQARQLAENNKNQKERKLQDEEATLKTLKTRVILDSNETPADKDKKIKDQEDLVEKARKDEEDSKKILKDKAEEEKTILDKKTQTQNELLSIGSSLSEMAAQTKEEKEKIIHLYEQTTDDKSTVQIKKDDNFHIARKIGAMMGSTNLLVENAKKIGRDKKTKELETNVFLQEKNAKEVKEAIKEIEERDYSLDEIKGMVKSGYGSPAMKTALFKKLASSSKHFGDFLSEFKKNIKKDTGDKKKDEEEAEKEVFEILKKGYTEPEVLKALKAVDDESRKSNNLSQIGRVIYDSRVGKVRFSNPTEKTGLLKNFAKSMNAKAINKIHKQSFSNEEAIQALAEGPDWVKLKENENFGKLMTRDVRESFKSKESAFVNHFNQNNDLEGKAAFLDIINK